MKYDEPLGNIKELASQECLDRKPLPRTRSRFPEIHKSTTDLIFEVLLEIRRDLAEIKQGVHEIAHKAIRSTGDSESAPSPEQGPKRS